MWSKVNVEKVEMLSAGRMQEPGMAEVRAAQADGRWGAAYESQKRATVPAEVTAALADNTPAGCVRRAGQDVAVPALPAGVAGSDS